MLQNNSRVDATIYIYMYTWILEVYLFEFAYRLFIHVHMQSKILDWLCRNLFR